MRKDKVQEVQEFRVQGAKKEEYLSCSLLNVELLNIERVLSYRGDLPQYLFTGKELDYTGMYYFGARYYDPRISLWMSVDPAFEKYIPTIEQLKNNTEYIKLNNKLDFNISNLIVNTIEENKKNIENEKEINTLIKHKKLELINKGVFNSSNLSLFTYTSNNPVVYLDPNGLWDISAGVTYSGIGFSYYQPLFKLNEEGFEWTPEGQMSVSLFTIGGVSVTGQFNWFNSDKSLNLAVGAHKHLSLGINFDINRILDKELEGIKGITIDIGVGAGSPVILTIPLPKRAEDYH